MLEKGRKMEDTAISVEFPLRGEWVAVQTPKEKIPSHGIEMFGQKYAFDFLRIDSKKKGFKFYRQSLLYYLLFGVKLNDCYGWSQPIYSPFDAIVISSNDGWPERVRPHLVLDLFVVLKNAFFSNPIKSGDLRSITGNHIILKKKDTEIYCLIAHAKTGSIKVTKGDEIKACQHIADVGHSGNSTAPHLHFQLMDRADLLTAKGLPCKFEKYEVFREDMWINVNSEIPGKREFVRYGLE